MSARGTVGGVLQDALPMVPVAAPRIDRAALDGAGFGDDACTDDCCER